MTVPVQLVDHIVAAAMLAPSVHNTQPWRFVHGAGDVLEVFADRGRQLRVLDPTGRQLHLSCGAAIQHATVAARSLGVDPLVELLPDGAAGGPLAQIRLSLGAPATQEERELAEALLSRHTYRGRFADSCVPAAVLDVMRLAVEREGAALRLVDSQEEMVSLEVLLSRADAEQVADPAYRAELHRWRGSPVDGVPASATDRARGAGSSLRLRRFEGDGTAQVADPPVVDHPVVAVLVTAADGRSDWLTAGRALGSLLLTAADHGVFAQPLGQLTDWEGNRRRLAGLMGVVGTPQLALRFGHAIGVPVATPRRALDDVLERSSRVS